MDRILFTIDEPMTLTTATTAIQGGLLFEQVLEFTADAIIVEKGQVRLLVTRESIARESKRKRPRRVAAIAK